MALIILTEFMTQDLNLNFFSSRFFIFVGFRYVEFLVVTTLDTFNCLKDDLSSRHLAPWCIIIIFTYEFSLEAARRDIYLKTRDFMIGNDDRVVEVMMCDVYLFVCLFAYFDCVYVYQANAGCTLWGAFGMFHELLQNHAWKWFQFNYKYI